MVLFIVGGKGNQQSYNSRDKKLKNLYYLKGYGVVRDDGKVISNTIKVWSKVNE